MARLRRLFEDFANKGDLMAGVMQRLEISPTMMEHDPLGTDFQGMVSRCLGCRSMARCERWLNEQQCVEALEQFCPNARFFLTYRQR